MKPSLWAVSTKASYFFMPVICFGALYLQLLEAAQSLSLSLTKANKSDLETDADEKNKKDEADDAGRLVKAGEGSVVAPEMGPDEV